MKRTIFPHSTDHFHKILHSNHHSDRPTRSISQSILLRSMSDLPYCVSKHAHPYHHHTTTTTNNRIATKKTPQIN